MQALRIIKKLPPLMRTTDWKYLIDGIDIEIQNFKSRIEEKKTIFDVAIMTYDDVINIAQLLNIKFSVSVFQPSVEDQTTLGSDPDLLAFLIREIAALPFKITYKATVILYESFYKVLARSGGVFLYATDGSGNIWRYSVLNPLSILSLLTPDQEVPYQPNPDYSGSALAYATLDSGRTLDSGETLDSVTSYQTTNHIAVEIILDRLVTKITLSGSSTYLLSSGFFSFLENSVNFSRRAREVAHVGAQLGIQVDTSGKIDSPENPRAYTIPSIHANALMLPTAFAAMISASRTMHHIIFGVGTRALPSQGSPAVPLPTSLQTPIISVPLVTAENRLLDPWSMAAACYQGGSVGGLLMHDASGYHLGGSGAGVCDGSNHAYSGVLPYAPIVPGQVKISFVHGGSTKVIVDDGLGNLVGGEALGTIDYQTGAYSFDTVFSLASQETIISSAPPATSAINVTLIKDVGASITAHSFSMTYRIGGRYYVAIDDGSGSLLLSDGLNPRITSGTINYSTGNLIVAFNTALDVGFAVTTSYAFQRSAIPDAASSIIATSYYGKETIDITEAGLYDSGNNLIAYATFPPVEFISQNHHLSMHFFLYNGAFA